MTQEVAKEAVMEQETGGRGVLVALAARARSALTGKEVRARWGGGVWGGNHVHDRSLSDHRPSHPYKQCPGGAPRAFTDHADTACTKREAP